MSAYYSVIQFVPDEVRGERINIGVIVFDEESNIVQCRFLKNWQRVRCFVGGEDINYLKDVVSEFQEATSAQLKLAQQDGYGRINQSVLHMMYENWRNTIQITEPIFSKSPLPELLPKMADRFLYYGHPEKEKPRSRNDVKIIVERSITSKIKELYGQPAKNLVKRDFPVIGGDKYRHFFDVSVANDINPYLLLQSVSFEATEAHDRRSVKGAIAYSISDVKDKVKSPIYVVALPPKQRGAIMDEYDDFMRSCRSMGAQPIKEDEMDDYSTLLLRNYIPKNVIDLLSSGSPSSPLVAKT